MATDAQPTTSKSSSIVSDGMQTDIHCETFSDKHLIVVSQLQNFGTWIEAWCDESQDGRCLYQTKVLLGKRDDPLLHIYARQIIEKVFTTGTTESLRRKPVVLSLALKPEATARSAKTMQAVLNKLFEINTWQQ